MRSVQLRTLDELVAAASLPAVMSTRVLSERGFDNQLLVGVLLDGREVLLRQKPHPSPAPALRTGSLTLHDVGAPRLHIGNDAGAVLVDFVPGETLAALASRGALGDHEWRLVDWRTAVSCSSVPGAVTRPVWSRTSGVVPAGSGRADAQQGRCRLPGCAPSVRPWCRC